MKAVVFHGVGDIRLDDVPDPLIEQPTDAIVRITTSAICGTDLHIVRGTLTGMKPGTIIGHEAVGVVDAIGPEVRNLNVGDRVVIPSTIACGVCSYCRAGYTAQCDHANPGGRRAGTAFFAGPASAGAFHGLQAEKARVAFTKSLAKQVAKRGVRVNAVAPGPYWTALQVTGGASMDKVTKFGEDTPLGRPGQPAEIAPVYVLLASAEATDVTGQVYGASGGRGVP
jgi:threonine dehydrogenase-like Zn-dependent dehydrogenase